MKNKIENSLHIIELIEQLIRVPLEVDENFPESRDRKLYYLKLLVIMILMEFMEKSRDGFDDENLKEFLIVALEDFLDFSRPFRKK